MSDADFTDLRKRITQLEDEREIRYLLGRYGHYADLGHLDAWLDQWTDDGVYDVVTVVRDGAGYDGARRFAGKDELRAMMTDPAAHKAFEGRSLHLQDVNLVIRIDGDAAYAHGYSITLLRDGGVVTLRSAGMVRWGFRRIDGAWRISAKDRRIMGDGTAFVDTPAMPAHDASRPGRCSRAAR